jgi:uncharacterized protein (DUF58 family)
MNHAAIHSRMQHLATIARLPLSRGRWSGTAGVQAGKGSGSSIEFQDQRAYLPGDDPRHINWLASARSGTPTIKLYRAEVSPRVDLVVDLSPSMFVDEAKATRTWELAYFALESVLRQGGHVRILALDRRPDGAPVGVAVAAALAHDWPAPRQGAPATLADTVERLPLRAGSLRVFVGDLLDPSPPPPTVARLAAHAGQTLLLVPVSRTERAPEWPDAVEFEDCETGRRRRQIVDDAIRRRYAAADERHFAQWREAAHKRGVGMARIFAEGDVLAALRGEALAQGVVEIT